MMKLRALVAACHRKKEAAALSELNLIKILLELSGIHQKSSVYVRTPLCHLPGSFSQDSTCMLTAAKIQISFGESAKQTRQFSGVSSCQWRRRERESA